MSKTQVIAVTVIHRTIEPGQRGDALKGISPVKPKVQIIQPGTMFLTSSTDEFDELLAAKAIRLPEARDQPVAESVVAAEPSEPVRQSGRQTKKATTNRQSNKASTNRQSNKTTKAKAPASDDGADLV